MASELSTSDLSESYIGWVHEQVQHFTDSLSEGQAVEVIVPLPNGSHLVARSFGFCNPDLIKISGTDSNGAEACLVIHKSAFQILLRQVNQGPEVNPEVAFQDQSQTQAKEILFDESA